MKELLKIKITSLWLMKIKLIQPSHEINQEVERPVKGRPKTVVNSCINTERFNVTGKKLLADLKKKKRRNVLWIEETEEERKKYQNIKKGLISMRFMPLSNLLKLHYYRIIL